MERREMFREDRDAPAVLAEKNEVGSEEVRFEWYPESELVEAKKEILQWSKRWQ